MQERIIDIRNDDDRRFYEIYLPGVKIGQNTDRLPILQSYFLQHCLMYLSICDTKERAGSIRDRVCNTVIKVQGNLLIGKETRSVQCENRSKGFPSVVSLKGKIAKGRIG